jgi:hypothetical protein
MNMKDHILAALREQLERWDELLGSLSEEQITAPRFDLNWSIKDVVAHLWGWQQISIARMDAAARDREPGYSGWLAELPEGWDDDADRTNAWFYQTQHEKPWSEVYENWRAGYLRFIGSGEPIPEKDLLDGDRSPWLKGFSPAFILLASYAHHQEHLDQLMARLER